MKWTCYTFILIALFFFGQEARAQNVSSAVNLVCSDQVIVNESPQPTPYNNILVSCETTYVLSNNLVFYMVYIASGTTFTFEIDPVEDIDFDFGSWLNPNLENLGVADRSSRNHPPPGGIFTTGLDLTDPELCEETSVVGDFVPGKVKYYDVQPGDRILIAVDRWEAIESGYTLTFGGDAVLDCDLVGGTYNVCDYDLDGQESFDLAAIQADYPDATVQFYDNYNNALANNGTGTVSGNYTAATGTNILYARIEDNTGTLVYIKWFYFNVNSMPAIQSPEPIAVCTYTGAVTAVFDLTSSEENMLLENGLDVTYYTTQSAAQTADVLHKIATQEAYTSGSTSVFARIENIGGCFLVQEIELDLVDFTIVPTTINESKCDTDNDGVLMFDLNSYLPELGVTNPQNYTIHYFINEAYANQPDYIYAIASPQSYSLNLGQTRTIYVRIAIGECFTISEIHLSTFPDIILNPVVPQLVCDDNFDGIYTTNLRDLEDDLTASPATMMFEYFSSLQNIQDNVAISNPQQYVISSLPATVWVKVSNQNGCFRIVPITYNEGADIPSTGPPMLYLCPDFSGEGTIDLSSYQSTVTSLAGVAILWFPTYQDAANQTNPIGNSTYSVSLPTGTIYARIRKRDYCPVIVPLNYRMLSSDITSLTTCDNDGDGIATFDLTESLAALDLQGFNQSNIRYYEDQNVALMGDFTQAIQNPEAYTGNVPGSVYMRVQVQGGCYVINEVQLFGIQRPPITVASPIQICSGNSVTITPIANGQTLKWYASATATTPLHTGGTFNTPTLTADTSYWIGTANNSGCSFSRIEVVIKVTPRVTPSFDQVLPICLGESLPALPTVSVNGVPGSWSPVINPLETTTYTFTPDNGQCAATAQMTIQVLTQPVITTLEPAPICEGTSAQLSVNTDAAIVKWYASETSPVAIFTGPDFQTLPLEDNTTFWVEGFNGRCTSGRFPVNVTVIQEPFIQQILRSEPFSDNNTITLIPALEGYYYQLDDEAPQDNGFFEELSLGRHTIIVSNECGSLEIPFKVIGHLKYFTPNGDGTHERWNIIGLGDQDAKVEIFDRYGKYLATINTSSLGWDGKYNGHDLPATDYWFRLDYRDMGNDKEYLGHFSLLR